MSMKSSFISTALGGKLPELTQLSAVSTSAYSCTRAQTAHSLSKKHVPDIGSFFIPASLDGATPSSQDGYEYT